MKRLIFLFNLLLISGIATRAQNSPDWARHAVWYQIFPERFANGDPSNDPTLASLHGAYPHNDSSAWTIHPWGSDWYELQPYEKQNGQNIWYNIQRRRYGGDLQGIINKLDYISELGITAIYLNPIFYAPSLHKYDAICFHHVDPYFGPDPEGDIELMKSEVPDDPKSWHWTAADKLALQLIKEVHARGMKIIFDGVWNHMGIENVFLKDVAEKGKLSKYANWFIIEDWDKPGTMNMPFTYKGWFGVKELPEIREDADGIVSGPKEYIYSCTARWMSPDGDVTAGIDGWRLDVAYCVNRKFWKEWNRYVHHLNKYSYTTAEIVDGPVEVKKYLDAGFDAVMNYNFGFAAHDYFINHNLGSTGTQLYSKWTEMFLNYQQQMYVMQNLFDSHDAQRLSSAIANPDLGHFAEWGKFFGATQAEHNAGYNVSCPGSENMWQRMRLMIAYQMCMPGAPMIYYGDECGMWGGNDPDCRKPMVWPELTYVPERYDSKGTPTRNDAVQFDTGLYVHYRQWIAFRRLNPILAEGDLKLVKSFDTEGAIILSRTLHKNTLYIVINKHDHAFEYSYRNNNGNFPDPIPEFGPLLMGEPMEIKRTAQYNYYSMKPLSIAVYRSK